MGGILDGKVAIITGAGRGIGGAHALAFADQGASIVVNDSGGRMDGAGSDHSIAEATAAKIQAAGGVAIADHSDLADWGLARQLVERCISAYGKVDILVNNAGIVQYSTILEETEESWRRTLAVNLGATAAMLHWVGVHWRDAGAKPGRAVVNTCSPTATAPNSGCAAYSASKGAIATLTLTSAIELADLGARVNAIVPVARTRMSESVTILADAIKPVSEGFDRMSPEHAARAALYLASPSCKFTGRLLGIEGDEAWLYTGYSVNHYRSNENKPWSVEDLASAFSNVSYADMIKIIAQSAPLSIEAPDAEVFEALAKVERGEPAKLVPFLHT